MDEAAGQVDGGGAEELSNRVPFNRNRNCNHNPNPLVAREFFA